MDPFKSDPDQEEDHPLPLRPGQQHTSTSSTKMAFSPPSRHVVRDDMDEDREGPPPSVMLDIPSDSDQRTQSTAPESTSYGNTTAQHQQQQQKESTNLKSIGFDGLGRSSLSQGESTPRESVRLGKMRTSNAPIGYQDENEGEGGDELDEDDAAPRRGSGVYEDEEAGLMDEYIEPSPLSSSDRRDQKFRRQRRANSGFFASFAENVRKRTRKIRREDILAGDDSLRGKRDAMRGLAPNERALWTWANVDNLDEFLQEVYSYYVGKGIFCITLSRVLNLLTIAFVIGFSTFLLGCVNYSKIKEYSRVRRLDPLSESAQTELMLGDVLVDQCVSRFSGFTLLVFITFMAFYGWQVVRFGLGLSRLMMMHNFYTHLLGIPDAEVQSIPWHEVVSRISHLRETHPVTSMSSSAMRAGSHQNNKLDAHDVANRIMRQENYLIALFNKDVLDLTIPLPGLRKARPAMTKTLEWNLTFSLLGFLFDRTGQVRRQFVTDKYRNDLIEGLKRRFIFMAVINAIFAPFIVVYLLLYSFFRYFEEYHKNPANLGSRQYTQFALWKFREFNELPHLFRRRCHNSYPWAQRYVDQFPKERTAIVARFVSFIAGSFMAVLLLASVIDWDLVVHFYITPQYNVLFFITVLTAILAVSRGLVPDKEQTFEPEMLLRCVIEHTHYLPEHWKGRLHSTEVHSEFGSMYPLKITIFLSELLSVIVTPFVLWQSLPKSAPALIDFFREFTIHVDGLGYVCSFAVFDFARHGNVNFGVPNSHAGGKMASKEGKMEQSLLGFRAANPDWHPTDPHASFVLSKLAQDMGASSSGQSRTRSQDRKSALAADLNGTSTFTPASSTLAQRSQFYHDAFEKSISLARPSNAAALQASAVKAGRTSSRAATKKPSKAMEDVYGRTINEEEEEEGEDGLQHDPEGSYADARMESNSHPVRDVDGQGDDRDETSLRGLLNHFGSRW